MVIPFLEVCGASILFLREQEVFLYNLLLRLQDYSNLGLACLPMAQDLPLCSML
jgi:hypothetical protein